MARESRVDCNMQQADPVRLPAGARSYERQRVGFESDVQVKRSIINGWVNAHEGVPPPGRRVHAPVSATCAAAGPAPGAVLWLDLPAGRQVHPAAKKRRMIVEMLLAVPIVVRPNLDEPEPWHLRCPHCGSFTLVCVGTLPAPSLPPARPRAGRQAGIPRSPPACER